jgi:hypothetical protein
VVVLLDDGDCGGESLWRFLGGSTSPKHWESELAILDFSSKLVFFSFYITDTVFVAIFTAFLANSD